MTGKGVALALASLMLVTAAPASAQTRARTGAVLGGAIGAAATGALGALLAQGVCDAADCSGEWIDGAVPGAVLGGLGGAALGAALGALLPDPTPGFREPGRFRLDGLVEGSANRAEWNSIDQALYGGRVLVGARRGGFLIGPSVEWLSGGGWRLTDVGLAARLDADRGPVRPYLELGGGWFGWRHPAVLASCDPGQPCNYTESTLEDDYLGVAGSVGVAVGDRTGTWRVFGALRYHFAPSRPGSDPLSTTTRQLRQLAVGGEFSLGRRVAGR